MKTKMNWREEIPTLRKYIEEDKMTYSEVAKIYNCTIYKITSVCYRYNIKYHYPANKPWSEEEIEIVRDSLEKGLSYKEIAEKIPGRTYHSVAYFLNEYKKKYDLHGTGEKYQEFKTILSTNKDKIIQMRLDGYDNKEISKHFGISLSSVFQFFTENKIEYPTSDELADRGIFRTKGGLIKTDLTKEKLQDRYYTIYEVADILKVHHNTIRRAIKSGRLKAERIGTTWRISKTELK
jgi:excisionase family DNA binding protein